MEDYKRDEKSLGYVELAAEFAAGSTASMMGEKHGKTRSAVMGCVHRFRKAATEAFENSVLTNREAEVLMMFAQVHAGSNSRSAKPPKKRARNPGNRKAKIKKPKTDSQNGPPRLRREHLSPHVPMPDAPEPRNLTILDLEPHDCRFPISEVPGVRIEHLFCGQPAREASPYCHYHSRLAYVTPRRLNSRKGS